MLFEIGKFEGKITEVEYPINNFRLDVVWKRIRTGNPTHVFEVQIAGNFFEALTKLKHAWDKWNSRPYLVTTEKYMEEAKSLLEGSFHEMRDDARIVNWREIVKLHRLLKEASQIKSEIQL
jgi:predicted RNA-binding protein